ncbi:LysR family transcriptional regulator [Gallaecimonas mangrovi]|uniref:LysR family transcriptional regulator n=1 Tax=Gallaecimonas mangrovi TaxID=2291597 RepID=UPI000E209683|nr:LysR family transcriptional regulator [Gallaecimonas mangrovi]
MKQPSLDELTAFREIAQQRSFRKAADQLGVSRSALSHVMKGLEDKMGVQLLRRTTRSVSLTEAGDRLLSGLSPLLGGLEQLLFDVGHDQQHLFGEVRINGSEAAIAYLLDKVVPTFKQRYPGIGLDLVCNGQLIDIVAQQFDAGIRLGEAVPKDMVALPLGPKWRFIAVASAQYLASHPAPVVPEDLHHHHCIRQRLPSGKRYHWEFAKNGQAVAVDVPGQLSLDNNTLMVKAAAQGLGIAYVPEGYAHALLARGQLQMVLDDWCPLESGLYLYFPRYRHMAPGLRALVDVVKERDWQ